MRPRVPLLFNKNFFASIGFVRLSATIRSVRQSCSLMTPCSTISLIKWYFMSMCFVRLSVRRFLEITMHPLLSSRIGVARVWVKPSLSRSVQIYGASLAAPYDATYSVSTDEVLTVHCLLLFQLTGLLSGSPCVWIASPIAVRITDKLVGIY
jgi:hypothetical protein